MTKPCRLETEAFVMTFEAILEHVYSVAALLSYFQGKVMRVMVEMRLWVVSRVHEVL